jgi:FdhE protein
LTTAAAVVAALARALRETTAELPAGVPDAQAAEARLADGIPALTGEPLLSWSGLLAGAGTLAEALADTPAGEASAAVAEGLARQTARLDGDMVAAAALAGAWEAITALAPVLGTDPDALVTVLDYASRPALRAGAAALAPVLAGAAWSRGHCPACGAPPALSVIRGKEGERRLHCGRCATSWPYARVRCPSCGERDHEQLGLLHAAGEGEYRRAEVCERCRGYVKSVALLDPPDVGRLLELDLETAALDFMAVEAGYSRWMGGPGAG